MSLFGRTKVTPGAEPETPASTAGRKIILNFGGWTSDALLQMATATLQAGGFDLEEANKPKPVEIGDKMPDGTIYAGISPDTGKPLYAIPADASLTMTFNQATEYAAKLDAHGHHDWRLPTKAELNVLFNNRAAIGGFNVSGSDPAGWYWSGTQDYKWGAWDQRFSDGYQDDGYEDNPSSVRCVR